MTARLRAAVAGLAALALLAAIVGGLPVVLYRFGGSPLPARLPGWHHLAGLLAASDNGSAVVAVIRDCAWLAWLLFTACVLAESEAALRSRRAPWLGLGGIQKAAAHLVALAALAVSASAAVTPSASAAVMTSQQHPGAPPPVKPRLTVLDGMAAPDSTAARPVVIVQPGDCLWSIAQRYLGAGDRYPDIARLNYGRQMNDGQVLNIRRRCTCSGASSFVMDTMTGGTLRTAGMYYACTGHAKMFRFTHGYLIGSPRRACHRTAVPAVLDRAQALTVGERSR